MATNFGEAVHDSTIRRQIFLERFKTSTVKKLMEHLDDVDLDIIDRLRSMEDSRSRSRLEAVLKSVRDIQKKAMEELANRTGEQAEEFAREEMGFVTRSLNAALPESIAVAVQFIQPSEDILFVSAEKAYRNHLVQGKTVKEWIDGLSAADGARFEQAVRIGFTEGQSIDSIVRRVSGSRSMAFRDGVRRLTRVQAESIVRTTVQAASTAARERVYAENSPLIEQVRWVSTLDGRTTPICRALDDNVFPIDDGPRPPVHIRCRSTTIPEMRSFRDMGLDRDEPPKAMRPYVRSKQRLKDIPKEDRDLLVGRVKGGTSYDTWLRRQPKAFQEDVMGVSKAKLFRDGGLKMEKFVDIKSGHEFTLNELRRREPEAFSRAGL